MTEKYDFLILGGGGSGLAAGMYGARLNLKTLILGATSGTELPIGGVITTTDIVENYPGKRNFKSVILRYPSIYGKGQYGGIIHYYYERAKKNQEIEVFSEGIPLRNVIYVSDVVKANMLILENKDKLNQKELFMIGVVDSRSMKELAQIIVDKLNSKSKINLISKKTFNNVQIDISKAKKILNFEPREISEGIDLYIKDMGEKEEI